MTDFYIKQGDTSPSINTILQDESNDPVDITNFNEVEFHMKRVDASSAKVDTDTSSGVVAVTPADGEVEYQWSSGDTDTSGKFLAEFQVEYSDGSTETFPNTGYIEIRIEEEIS